MTGLIKNCNTCPLILFVSICYLFSQPLLAQDQASSSTMVGLSAAYTNTPAASDFKDSGGDGEIDKFEFFLDFGTLRLAINTMHGLDGDQDPVTLLGSNSTYIAYRAKAYGERSKIDAYLMGGIAVVSSSLRSGNEVIGTSDDYGYVLGSGVSYLFFNKLGLGIQLLRIAAKGDLSGKEINTGSDQIQMVFLYPF